MTRKAWLSWFGSSFSTLRPSDRAACLEAILRKVPDGPAAEVAAKLDGLDYLSVGLAISADWSRAGYPGVDAPAGDDAEQSLFELVLDPFKVDEHGRSVKASSRGRTTLYREGVRDDASKARLLEVLSTHQDRALTETVFENLAELGTDAASVENLMFFWRGVEESEPAWRVATRVIAERLSDAAAARDVLRAEISRLGKAQPKRRGSLLYVAALYDPHGRGLFDKVEMRRTFGAVGRADFESFIDQGPDAIAHAGRVLLLASPGWSRVDVLLPRLDGYLRSGGRLDEVATRLCHDRDPSELKRIYGWLRRRLAQHPEEGDALRKALDKTGPGGC
jgi:hypothetical protein